MLGCGFGSGANQVATLNCVFPLMANLIYWLLTFSGTIALILIIISGIRLIISGGEAKTVETAKKSLTYALAGLLLVFMSFLILNAIAYFTHVACLGDFVNDFPNAFQSCGGTGGRTIPANCSDENPNGSCPSEQTCAYDPVSGHYICQQAQCGAQNGYCSTGTCVYVIGSNHWVCQ
jgi:hypothetical protein